MAEVAFVIRTLPPTGLKGAFRVHFAPETLTQVGLKLGDICLITAEDGMKGAGIAWRAADRMGNNPKQQSIKMTETLRDAFGFKQGSQVTVAKASTTIQPAKKIVLTEVSSGEGGTQADDNCWNGRCIATIIDTEAVSVGTIFEVGAPGGVKRRYCVEHISAEPSQEGQLLFHYDDSTVLEFGVAPQTPTTANSQVTSTEIDASMLSGLQAQIEQLNMHLFMLCCKARSLGGYDRRELDHGILLAGYEGTGKTTLLKALHRVSGPKKVLTVDRNQLLGTPTKNQAYLSGVFQEALASQPSLVLIDDLHKSASQADSTTSSTATVLQSCFDTIAEADVLVVATATDANQISKELLTADCFSDIIDLAIPDSRARAQILIKLLSSGATDAADIAQNIAARTHGYTGADLARLVKFAARRPRCGGWREYEDWISVDSPNSTPDIGERSGSSASTLVERPLAPPVQLTAADFDLPLTKIRPSALREIIVEPPKITFNDIGGSDSLKARFDRLVKWPLEHPEIFAALPNKKPRRGVLLYGPPGCSKTMTAQAVASTYGWNFIAIKGAELISMYVGESERAIRDIFRKARQAAPTIIFFDEIDSIASARSSSADSSKTLNVVTTLLNEMDGFEAAKNVLVLAATNAPASLDPAILRPGRFDEHVYLGVPNEAARAEIWKICIRGAPRSEEIDLPPVVAQSQGMSGAEIKHAWGVAEDIAVQRAMDTDGAIHVTNKDVLEALSKAVRGISAEMLRSYDEFGQRGQIV